MRCPKGNVEREEGQDFELARSRGWGEEEKQERRLGPASMVGGRHRCPGGQRSKRSKSEGSVSYGRC